MQKCIQKWEFKKKKPNSQIVFVSKYKIQKVSAWIAELCKRGITLNPGPSVNRLNIDITMATVTQAELLQHLHIWLQSLH